MIAMKYYCIADEDTVRGFLLAGVPGQAVASAEQAYSAIMWAVAQPDIGILIVSEPLADGLRRDVDSIRLDRDRPLIVEIPSPEQSRGTRRGLRQLVHNAIGIHLDAKEGL